jgi:uncharacterized membrane protein YeaQ/YmgE (transglycosylase-associated protein family)
MGRLTYLPPKGTLTVWDADHLVFADIRSPRTIANLKQNSAIEVNVVDWFTRKGYRFKGTATVIESGALFDEGVSFYAQRGLSDAPRAPLQSSVLQTSPPSDKRRQQNQPSTDSVLKSNKYDGSTDRRPIPRSDSQRREAMINLIVWLIAGGLLGWMAGLIMHTGDEQGTFLNILVGIIGAAIAGILFGASTINQADFSFPALVVSLVGAIILLALINLFSRRALR